jgi:hypothetical protein
VRIIDRVKRPKAGLFVEFQPIHPGDPVSKTIEQMLILGPWGILQLIHSGANETWIAKPKVSSTPEQED